MRIYRSVVAPLYDRGKGLGHALHIKWNVSHISQRWCGGWCGGSEDQRWASYVSTWQDVYLGFSQRVSAILVSVFFFGQHGIVVILLENLLLFKYLGTLKYSEVVTVY